MNTLFLRRPVVLVATLCLAAITACQAQDAPVVGSNGPFVEKPYLQLGNAPSLQKSERLDLLFQTEDTDAKWSIEVQSEGESKKRVISAPTFKRVAVAGVPAHRVYSATLTGLKPGMPFTYTVAKDGKTVFSATGTARKAANQPYRFVVFGDCGQNNAEQKAVAYQTFQAKPDFVFITGDIVYNRGRVSEYRTKYFPIYNADEASIGVGAPLSRSIPFMASPGNHDILHPDMNATPDTMAYFYYWSQPLNGPISTVGAKNTPDMTGTDENQKAFLSAAGDTYPRMANFSFDYGNAHWTVLDANPYVDWTDAKLREWVEKDLASAKSATWKFVGFHQPGFNSSKNHFSEQQMRLLADVFEKGGVNVVFNGHVHNYQRSFPLRFATDKASYGAAQTAEKASGQIDGALTLDKTFDGNKNTKANGVIYLVTGAGGAGLYNPEQQDKPETWQPFTTKYVANVNSFTVVDVNGKTLTVRQIAGDGHELDRFTLTR